MKKFAFISGALALSLAPLGIVCKILHVPGAHLFFILGIGIFSLVFIPSIFKYLYSRER